MENFEESLNKAILLCDDNPYIDIFSQIYSFTTENIASYIKYFDLKDKKLLTVGSSGDQILNAFYYGARDITLVDINEFSKYYIYVKISAILSLDYLEFQRFFFLHGYDIDTGYYNKNRFSKDVFNEKIKPTLRLFDYESYLFFDELLSVVSPSRISDRLFDDDECRNNVIRCFNIYLKDEESYNKLKNKLKSISINFIKGDIFKEKIEDKFDNIFLSNLCTWYNINKMKELIVKLDNNLNKDGSMLISYLYYTNFYDKNYDEKHHKIYDIKNTRKYFADYITEHHKIKDGRSILWNEKDKNDLVLIYRKK